MTKAASLSIGLVLLLATPAVLWAQTPPTKTATDAAIHKQADMINLRDKLVEANESTVRGDLTAAAASYEAALALVESIGDVPPIQAQAEQTRQGLVAVKMELARRAYKNGQYQEAQALLDRVLRVDPNNAAARQMSAVNQKVLAEMKGSVPDPEFQEMRKTTQTNRELAMVMARNAGVLMEAGKLDEAERMLEQALKLDRDSLAANSYLFQIKEIRFNEATRRRERDSRDAMVKVTEQWKNPDKGLSLQIPNPYTTNTLIHTGKGRQAIMEKLNRIRIDTVQYEGLGLGEVIRNLSEDVKKRDPGGKGVNFLINPNPDFAAGGGTTAVDPATGLALPSQPTETVDINSIAIKLSTPLSDLRLADVLDAIVRVAEKPIKFSVEDYMVVFSLRGPENPPVYIRSFRIDPNTFYQGLESVSGIEFGNVQSSGGSGGGQSGGGQSGQGGESSAIVPRVSVAGGSTGGSGGGSRGGGGQGGQGGLRFITVTNDMASVSSAVRNYFTTLGVDLGSPAALQAGKAVFWNDRLGELLVRATSQDLDMIEAAVQALNRSPSQVNIRTRFVEVTQEDNKAIGFDWYLGNIAMGGHRILGSGGTQPSFTGAPQFGNPEGTFPGSVFGGTATGPTLSDGQLSSGLRNSINAPAIASMTGILTDPQFKVVLRMLAQRKGVDLLSAPEVTTVSGRQAQVQVVDIKTIVTGPNLNAGSGQTSAPVGGNGTVNQAPQAVISQPAIGTIPFGPVLDVVPYISADGFTVQMTIIPTITEFVGYDDPGQFVAQAVTGGGLPVTAILPLPHYRVRQVTTSAIVWDGQTMVLGGLLSEDVTRFKDKIPGLGDLPLVGRLFRSESAQTTKKNLLIFVTPTILDPAGNRMHTDEELPFAQPPIPNQSRAGQ